MPHWQGAKLGLERDRWYSEDHHDLRTARSTLLLHRSAVVLDDLCGDHWGLAGVFVAATSAGAIDRRARDGAVLLFCVQEPRGNPRCDDAAPRGRAVAQ